MKNVIIGVHGLKNKPPKDLLEDWWKASISDGLERIGQQTNFHFELVYWADLEYPLPLDPNITDSDDPLFIEHPYIPISKFEPSEKERKIKKKILSAIEDSLDMIILHDNKISGIEKIVDSTIKRMFTDLDVYYHGRCKMNRNKLAKQAFRARLVEVLKKHEHDRIMLIGHSMGSIISYDTLIHNDTEIDIDSFLTVGSPLGFPLIIKKTLMEQNLEINAEAKPPTPENIKSLWLNFSDLDDKITMNYDLADDYLPNSKNIMPIDIIVHNNYEFNEQNNPHKVYGYLQSREVAEIIGKFLIKPTSFLKRLLRRLGI